MLNTFKIIFLIFIFGDCSGATVSHSNKENKQFNAESLETKTADEEPSFAKFINPDHLYYDSGKDNYNKITRFYVDYDKITCEDKFLPIGFFDNQNVYREAFVNNNGFLETKNIKTDFCALTKK